MIRASSLFSSAALVTVTGALVTTGSAPPQGGPDAAPNSYVRLQANTPGTEQTGHANISGTLRVGGFQMTPNAFQGQVLTSDASGNGWWQDPTFRLPYLGSVSHNGRAFELTNTFPSGFVRAAQFGAVSPNGTGVYGYGSHGTGANTGVTGVSLSSSGTGVFGFVQASGSGIGVFGQVFGSSGGTMGVRGEVNSTGGLGVYGFASATSGQTAGVLGEALSPTGWAVYAAGNFGAGGTKSFRIDHPFDPENKWLLHYCSESPEPQNFYNGIVVTDAQGYAVIPLPDYFDEINRDPRVQLTVDDESEDFVMVKVMGGVANGVCRIRTSKPSVKVYWEVKAVRNDKWVQKHGAPVEPEKEGRERGKYQHPELYGMPKEMGMNYRPPEKTSRRPKK